MPLKIVRTELRTIERPNVLPNTLNVGLSGGIGCGKTTVANMLQAQGAVIVNLDTIAHELTAAGGAAMPQIVQTFGHNVVTADGAMDRAKMREQVFHDPLSKQRLEAIIHPLIFTTAVAQAHAQVNVQANAQDNTQANTHPLCVVYDIPLLTQSAQWQSILDTIIVVDCAVETRIARVKKRNPELTRDMIQRIMASQAPFEKMADLADVILDNSQNDARHLQLQAQVNILTKHLQRQKNARSKSLTT